MSPPRLLGSSLVGAADQALLSAFNLAVGLAFIRFASKPEYATYALATTGLLLLQSVQNAVVNSPLATLAPAADAARRVAVDSAGWRLQARLMLVALGTGVLLSALVWLAGQQHWAELLGACTIAALGLMAREYRRAQCFLSHDAWRALRADALYAALALAALGGLLYAHALSAVTALAAIGLAGLLTGWRQATPPTEPQSPQALTEAGRAIWGCAKWALPSVVNSWLYANAYLFLVERLMSKDAVADLSASRLLLMPLSLLVVGWSSAFRPRASQWLAGGETDRVHRAAVRSAWAFVAASVAYGALLFAAMPLLRAGLLGDKYGSAALLAVPWLLFFTVAAVRSVGMSAMLASADAFRPLFRYGVMALVLALPCALAAALAGSTPGMPVALAVAEVFLLALIWIRGWPEIRVRAQGNRS